MSITARVVQTSSLTPHVVELFLKPETEVVYAAGQWVSLALPIGPHPPIKRVYSMASPMRDDGLLHLVFDRVPGGVGSAYLADLKVGAEVEIKSHLGNFTLPDPLQARLLFVARYTGIVPVFALLKALEAREHSGPIHLIYGSPELSERVFESDLKALSLPQLTVEHIELDATPNDEPEAASALKYAESVDLETLNAFICGVGEMVRPLRKALIDLGVPKRQVRAERFT